MSTVKSTEKPTANYNRQNKLFWGTFVKAIGKDHCYEVIQAETGSESWKELSEPMRDRVLGALSRKTGIQLETWKPARKAATERTGTVQSNVIAFPGTAPPSDPGTIANRISEEQSFTIEKLRVDLGWSDQRLEEFCRVRFHKPVAWLDSQAAHSLTYLLLKIDANKLKRQLKDNPEFALATPNDYIEAIKRRLLFGKYAKRV